MWFLTGVETVEINGAMPAAKRSSPIEARSVTVGAGNRKQGVLLDRHERVYRGRVQSCVVFVSGKEKSALASIVNRQTYRATKGEAGIMLLKRQSRQTACLVVGSVGVEDVVAEKVESAAAIFV